MIENMTESTVQFCHHTVILIWMGASDAGENSRNRVQILVA